MQALHIKLSHSFNQFFTSEKSAGLLLLIYTAISLLLTNSPLGSAYLGLWQMKWGGLSLELWINDALMAVFFLLIGLELERELYSGELSKLKNALLPIVAAVGGMFVPALIHFAFNASTPTQVGFGIPMATDIAFALGVLALLGGRVPASLKIFVVAFAVIDDLGAIIMIAVFYTAQVSTTYLLAAVAVWLLLIALNRLRVMALTPYLVGGAIMWFLMLKSGVHATIAGVMLAFAIPFSSKSEDQSSPSHQLEHWLHKPVAFFILPLFALANTGVLIGTGWVADLTTNNSLGIMTGLLVGKTVGVTLFSLLAVKTGLCQLPANFNWRHIVGAGMLGGIGFTMSIFITNLAFTGDAASINASKMAILAASLTAGISGFVWLRVFAKSET
jgi:Na+:H+ antiporter, NhaA family